MLTLPNSPSSTTLLKINDDHHERKHRIVKNAHVDIENVSIESGSNYCNWIEITKQKLKERENKLLRIKLNLIQKIFNDVKYFRDMFMI